ncbi:MAG: ABC transporter permease subunit [Rhodospirillaceae bacterium]|jgi:oligopeptide transport system permease protein|nr:ABC transporter permease subunit [Rhodospirillaceae bacterium]MBT5241262.1 ABC transporter permease subunit [Rhodospirillaceae bacterium]MBT5565103.1 ABC transporter permease subunit [Rhodospirillaceae bacterium]MBT6088125.1 ABC transporter permease subunit [Rhodospirillaceae bacterium]MBT6960104.1 ABC transporter permease subunit [Rhodospirillaceae bacterium]
MALLAAQREAQETLMAEAATIKGRSLWEDAGRRFKANKAAMAGVIVLGLITVCAIVAPWLSAYTIDDLDWMNIGAPPSLESGHWFGTDDTGKDMFVLTWMGARVSLIIGVMTTVVALSIGVIYGATAGYVGGRTDNAMMRFVDVLYALPLLFFIIILVTVFGRNIYLVFLAIGCVEWLTMARIVRGQTLSVKQKDFIEAARASGAGPVTIIGRHVLPNVIGPVIVYVTLLVPTNILVESYLSFLGLGVKEPLTSWGVLISRGANSIESTPWLLLIPATFLAITMFCFNFIGDGLRDALDPKDR